MPVDVLGKLSRSWYLGRISDEWRPRVVEAKQAILRGTGLTGAFWDLGR